MFMLNAWPLLCLLLSLVLVIASMKVSRRRYWIALSCLAFINAGGALAALLPLVLGIFMAGAFGSPVSAIGYLPLGIIAVVFIYPVLSLLPNFSAAKGRRFVAIVCGLAIAICLLVLLGDFQNSYFWQNSGVMVLLFLLLWLRVYELRLAVEAATEPETGEGNERAVAA